MVLADVPGVAPETVNVHVEGDELTIEGRVPADEYKGLKPLYVEYGVGGFYRRFTLGETIDRNSINAQVRNGVLESLEPLPGPWPVVEELHWLRVGESGIHFLHRAERVAVGDEQVQPPVIVEVREPRAEAAKGRRDAIRLAQAIGRHGFLGGRRAQGVA